MLEVIALRLGYLPAFENIRIHFFVAVEFQLVLYEKLDESVVFVCRTQNKFHNILLISPIRYSEPANKITSYSSCIAFAA